MGQREIDPEVFASGPHPKAIARTTGIARPTINQILTKLLKLGKLDKLGLGRSTRYRVKDIINI